jgi:hypothetical protein
VRKEWDSESGDLKNELKEIIGIELKGITWNE